MIRGAISGMGWMDGSPGGVKYRAPTVLITFALLRLSLFNWPTCRLFLASLDALVGLDF